MKKVSIIVLSVLLACSLSACTSDPLKAEQKSERQALNAKQKADRQVERAEKTLAVSTASTAAATANLAAKKQAQRKADADLQQITCPQANQ
ncbi:MAG TPA: hypothetical protein VGI71_16180 [Scandinavium sp.]|jgi:cytochrome c biogenesis protein ResB